VRTVTLLFCWCYQGGGSPCSFGHHDGLCPETSHSSYIQIYL
jgi:hypothetical protein